MRFEYGVFDFFSWLSEKCPACSAIRHLAATDKNLVQELAFECEYLHPLILAVAYIHEAVIRDSHAVDVVELLRSDSDHVIRRIVQFAFLKVGRDVAESSPHALESAGSCIENDDAAIAVSISDENLVRFRIDRDVGRHIEVRGIRVAFASSGFADLQDEFAFL